MSRRTRARRAIHLGAVVLAVLAHRIVDGEPITCSHAPPPGVLRVLSWNLENFPADHDVAKMSRWIERAAPQVVAIQEVRDADALAALLPEHEPALSQRGGARGQTLGVAIGADAQASPIVEHAALELGGRVRPAVSSHVRAAGLDFHLVVVHLKATPSGLDMRRLQWAALVDLVARLPLSGPGAGDLDLVLVGDFNATGADGMTATAERAALAGVLAGLGLRPIEPVDGCSAYWDGARRDAWLEPTLLDLAFVRGFAGADVTARALGACATHRCAPLRTTDAHPDPDIVGTSDHCPLLLELDSRG